MLPSHLLDPTKKKNERLNRTQLGVAPPALPPSLCVTGALSKIGRYRVVVGKQENSTKEPSEGSWVARKNLIDDNNGAPIILSYCIFRPRQLNDERKPPLLCLHGGPSVPSNYLLPIVNGVTDRAVIFYDQWGCGKSSRPELLPANDESNTTSKKSQYRPFSIPTMVEHLRQLIEEHWKLKRFHLLGHSFGGILAYEYLLTMKRRKEDIGWQQNAIPCSLILSSTPTSSRIIKSESHRLLRNLENSTGSFDDGDGDGAIPVGKDLSSEQQTQRKQSIQYSEEFRQTHECRLPNPPLSLMNAMSQMGPIPWRGIPAIESYEAEAMKDDPSYELPPALLMRGEYDLCTEQCMVGWKERLSSNSTEETILANCSHYAMLEDERLYGEEILRFVKLHDAPR